MPAPHPITRRYRAEELLRLRRADERRRYVASQRCGRIDANPHQIDAVIFALRRIPEGGCILADEVGLGKTIEAGLVIAQLLAEGASRILLVTPKPLLGQWREELRNLFGIDAHEVTKESGSADGDGVFVVGREAAGGRAHDVLLASGAFDLVVIDEAHELFAGIHRRYDKNGVYQTESTHARTAARVKDLVVGTPILLLTATPIQNSLTELWGLVQYVDPTGTLLGNLPTFRQLFCAEGDRAIAPGQAEELKARLASVVQRTLRRQAQEFMTRPFVQRRARVFDYTMAPDERSLYDDVTRYLLEPNLCAFRGSSRQLLLIGFHRRMASSSAALVASLERVAARLEHVLAGDAEPDTAAHFFADLEELAVAEPEPDDAVGPPDEARVRAELERVRAFVTRANALTTDSKALALIKATRLVLERGESGEGSGKVVVFTESKATQDYLEKMLVDAGVVDAEDITIFRGQNNSPAARRARDTWYQEVGELLPKHSQPSADIAVRMGLVHEFKTRTKVFISTEAGAKGLNLQFAETLINYDLPWNPQRIEQRIGRIHRYGQTRDVTIINFVAADNQAQVLTLEILTKKLDLFGTVLDVSDHVLHQSDGTRSEALTSALGTDFERKLREIHQRCRTLEEIEAEMEALRESMSERREHFEDTHERTVGLIESRFDETVRTVFKEISDTLSDGLAEFDHAVEAVVCGYLDAKGIGYVREPREGYLRLTLEPSEALPEGFHHGAQLAIGNSRGAEASDDPMHLGHAVLRAACDEAREATADTLKVRLRTRSDSSPDVLALRGRRGRLVLTKLSHRGFEAVDRLVPTAILEASGERGLEELGPDIAAALLELPPEDTQAFGPPVDVSDDDLEDAIEESLFSVTSQVDEHAQRRFEQTLQQVERSTEDKALLLRQQAAALDAQLRKKEAERQSVTGAERRTQVEAALASLQRRLDDIADRLLVLERRDDADYKRWRSHAQERRYQPPKLERILDVAFEIE